MLLKRSASSILHMLKKRDEIIVRVKHCKFARSPGLSAYGRVGVEDVKRSHCLMQVVDTLNFDPATGCARV